MSTCKYLASAGAALALAGLAAAAVQVQGGPLPVTDPVPTLVLLAALGLRTDRRGERTTPLAVLAAATANLQLPTFLSGAYEGAEDGTAAVGAVLGAWPQSSSLAAAFGLYCGAQLCMAAAAGAGRAPDVGTAAAGTPRETAVLRAGGLAAVALLAAGSAALEPRGDPAAVAEIAQAALAVGLALLGLAHRSSSAVWLGISNAWAALQLTTEAQLAAAADDGHTTAHLLLAAAACACNVTIAGYAVVARGGARVRPFVGPARVLVAVVPVLMAALLGVAGSGSAGAQLDVLSGALAAAGLLLGAGHALDGVLAKVALSAVVGVALAVCIAGAQLAAQPELFAADCALQACGPPLGAMALWGGGVWSVLSLPADVPALLRGLHFKKLPGAATMGLLAMVGLSLPQAVHAFSSVGSRPDAVIPLIFAAHGCITAALLAGAAQMGASRPLRALALFVVWTFALNTLAQGDYYVNLALQAGLSGVEACLLVGIVVGVLAAGLGVGAILLNGQWDGCDDPMAWAWSMSYSGSGEPLL